MVPARDTSLPATTPSHHVADAIPALLPQVLQVPGVDDKPRPFFNLGHSCFINAALTALFGPMAFRQQLLQIFQTNEERLRRTLWPTAVSISGTHREPVIAPAILHEERLAVTYVTSLRAPSETDNIARGRAIIPYLFTHRFYHRNQEDANEFLQALMTEADAPRLHRICQGLDTPILRCRYCHSERRSAPEWFNWLSLPLVHDGVNLHMTVQEALNAYFEPELLTDTDFRYRCDNAECQSVELPYKVHDLTVLPHVLCLQLKRWRTNRVEDALLHDVRCDEEIQCNDTIYVLKSVVCHMGSTPRSGHYTCRLYYPAANSAWWYYNNSERRVATPVEVLTTAPVRGSVERAYLAFYEKRDAV